MTQRTHASSADAEEGFARAHRELMVRRLPVFAAGWLGLGMILRGGLIARASLPIGEAVASLALQILVFVLAFIVCRRDPAAPRVLRVTLASCVALVFLATGFFARLGGSLEVLAFALFTISVGSSLAFVWGWRPALVVLAATFAGSVLAMPLLRLFVDPTEFLLEVLIGGGVSLIIAEASARSFRQSFDEERARAEAARRLAASHAAYRDLADNAPDLIFTHDLDGRITYVNDAFARFFGAAASTLIGRRGPEMVPQGDGNPEPTGLIARVIGGEEVPPQLFWVKGPAGRRWLECIINGMQDADGTVVGVRGVARDVTERHHAEEALQASLDDLRRSEERLRRLARRQASIREDERKRLGFDLHDDVCQELIGIGILIESTRRRVAEAVPELDADMRRIGGYVGEVGEHLRQLARDLRPMLLRDLGLEESLRSLVEGMTATGMAVTTVFPTAVPRLDEETEIGVYRIAQEALANAARHAGAHAIRLTLAVHDATLELEIVDDGRGFLPAARRGSEALGLVGMEERALALGGRLELRSAPGRGTAVHLTCPVTLRAAASAA
jgi:two-component system, NarL family, sensor histidine kinase UhpB